MASMKNNRELDSQIKNHIMIIRITWLLKELAHNVPDQQLILIEIVIQIVIFNVLFVDM